MTPLKNWQINGLLASGVLAFMAVVYAIGGELSVRRAVVFALSLPVMVALVAGAQAAGRAGGRTLHRALARDKPPVTPSLVRCSRDEARTGTRTSRVKLGLLAMALWLAVATPATFAAAVLGDPVVGGALGAIVATVAAGLLLITFPRDAT